MDLKNFKFSKHKFFSIDWKHYKNLPLQGAVSNANQWVLTFRVLKDNFGIFKIKIMRLSISWLSLVAYNNTQTESFGTEGSNSIIPVLYLECPYSTFWTDNWISYNVNLSSPQFLITSA